MKKADALLVASLILLGAALYAALGAGGEAARATVYLEGRPVWSCALSSEGEFEISGVQVVVENGCARIARSDCPDLYCVSCSPISRAGECLVCLPNRVSVTLSGEDMPDAVIY